jgi:hypothetical protein
MINQYLRYSFCVLSILSGVMVSILRDAEEIIALHSGVVSPTHEARKNPFVAGDPAGQVAVAQLARCVEAALSLGAVVVHDPSSRGEIIVHNRCKRTVAVLTSPIEIRIRRRPDQTFPSEVVGTPYVLVYIFPADMGLPARAFMGDSEMSVTSMPRYSLVKSGVSTPFALRGIERLAGLEPGIYRIIMLIPIAFASDGVDTDKTFDLRQSVDVHNRGHSAATTEIELPLSVGRIMVKSGKFALTQ